MPVRLVSMGLIASLLTGCGGASTGAAGGFTRSAPQNYDSKFNAFIDTGTLSDALDPTNADALEVFGTASYEGYLFLGSRTVSTVVDAVVGDLSLEFDLAGDSFSGTATGFRGRTTPGNEFPANREGTLSISEGFLVRTPAAVLVFADVDGSLGFWNETREMSGNLAGSFKGDDAQYVGGTVDVGFDVEPIEIGAGTPFATTIDRLTLEGGFVAEPR